MTALWSAAMVRPAARRKAGLIAMTVAFALTSGAAAGENLLAAAGGTTVVQRTTEFGADEHGDWRVENLIDGEVGGVGWASAEALFPQTIIFRMPANRRFNTLVINPGSPDAVANWARSIEVNTADPFPHMGGWRPVASIELAPEATDQIFTFDDIDGRFVQVVITAAQSPDATRVSLNEISLYRR